VDPGVAFRGGKEGGEGEGKASESVRVLHVALWVAEGVES